MKFELREPTYWFQEKIDDYLELYITKNEFKKSFENDKKQCHRELASCLEMYTAPCCFKCYPEMNYVESLYDKVTSKSKYKGILFSIKESGDMERHLVCWIV